MQLKKIFTMKNELKNFKLKDLGCVAGSCLSGLEIKVLGYRDPETNCECYGLLAEYYGLPIPGTQVSISEETYNEITSNCDDDESGYVFTKTAQICRLNKHAKFDIRPYNS